MPSMSAVGKRRPVSTTMMRSSYSTTVMFLPISPRPPRGRTRSLPPLMRRSGPWARASRGREQAVALEGGADCGQLALVRFDQRQAEPADVVAEQVQRGLDADRVRGDGERLEQVGQLVVDRAPALRLVDHAAGGGPADGGAA